MSEVLCWFCTYCLTTSNVVPPSVATKYGLVHSVGGRDPVKGAPGEAVGRTGPYWL